MILDGEDPTHVLARANQTLIYSQLPFETDGSSATGPLQTPFVVYADGLQRLGDDEFIVYFGGGDTVVVGAKIKVIVPRN